MIYYVTHADVSAGVGKYVLRSATEALYQLGRMDMLSCDTETTGLDPHTHRLKFLQMGNQEDQYVIDCETVHLNPFFKLLYTIPSIWQNAKFDLGFLYQFAMIPVKPIWDTMLAEQVLYQGLEPIVNLKHLVKKYCDKELDKKQRNMLFKDGVVSVADIVYAAKDIEDLAEIMHYQKEQAEEKDLMLAIEIECRAVKALAYIEHCGMFLNREKWRQKDLEVQLEIKKWKTELIHLISQNEKFADLIDTQLELFGSNDTKLYTNLDSPKQMLKIFETLGMDLSSADSKSNKSVSEKTLAKYKNTFPIVKIYLKYKQLKKDLTTYGASFLKHIHPETGRIHTNYTQLISTSRVSSSDPNLNNIPKEEFTRSCFEAGYGNVIIDIDYTDQEGIIAANYYNDPNLIAFYQGDFNDGHSFVAKQCFPEELKDIPMEDIKKERPDLRFKAKSARFAIGYGGNGSTIAKNVNIPKAEGVRIYDAYLKGFPGIAKYFKYSKNQTKKNGYILLSPFSRRKFYKAGFFNLSEDSYEYYDFLKKSLNYTIQGSAAEMIKLALIMLFDWIVGKDYFDIILIIGTVYDEIIIECPNYIAEEVATKAQEFMEKAASYYCKTIPISALPEIEKFWKH